MLRQSELPALSDIPSLDDEPTLFDPAAEWFVPGLTPLRGEAPDPGDDELGLRAILERPEVLVKAWQSSVRDRGITRAVRTNNRRGRRARSLSDAD